MTDHSQNPSETDSPDPDPRDQLLRFAKGLGYLEGECGQLETALTHKSYANEAMTPTEHNERLEFLGDAVLGLLIGHALMVRHPSRPEGDLSRLRAALVNARTLAGIGRSLELGGLLRLGRGEERTGGRAKESLLADAYEAVIGAVFLDLGLGAAEHAVLEHFAAWIAMEDATAPERDYKTATQEHWLCRRGESIECSMGAYTCT